MDTQTVKHIPVTMARETLDDLPEFTLPEGYSLRTYRAGEADVWAGIEAAVGEFADPAQALAHFRREFGPHEAEMEQRCLFLLDADGFPVGTTTAWYSNDFQGRPAGRIHWVGIVPEQQGRGLAKPLLSAAMRILAERHDRAYLTTQTTSWVAVRVYLDFGFAPVPGTPDFEEAWSLLARLTGHPALAT